MRLSVVAFFFIISITGFGQISAPSSLDVEPASYGSGDLVYFFPAIQMETLRCATPDPSETYSFVWTQHNPGDNTWTQPVAGGSGQTILISAPGGYQVRITGPGTDAVYRCWAFVPELKTTSISIEKETCYNLNLLAACDSVAMVYYHPVSGAPIVAPYNRTYQWVAKNNSDLSLTSTTAQIRMPAPVQNTDFEVTVTDRVRQTSVGSLSYTAMAVKASFDYDVIKADVGNEDHEKDLGEASGPVEIRFSDDSKGNITSWEWRFGDTGVTSERDPFYVFTKLGTDSVSLRVVNGLTGCQSINDTLTVTITDALLLVPNTFTPNGDGANDEFRVVYRSLKDFSMVVFNRWGRKMYESTNPAEGWDGTFAGGRVPPGVYFYYIEAKGYESGKQLKPRHGPIHLIRGK
jgi:gliding motility-associated-like protein